MIFTYWHLWPYAALMILLSVVVLFLNLRQRKKQTKLFKMRSWHQIPLIFWMRHGALSLMIIFLAFAMLRPLGGAEFLKQGERNLDILFVFDVSKSMKAVDMGAAENSEDRLTVGKNLIKAFLEVFKSGRVGLIEFAGEALVVSPLTTDYRVFRHYLEDLSTEDLAISGTNLSESLGLGLQHLEVGGFEDYTKMLVLISDGEETLNADMAFWARQAKEQNIPIFVIGIGSEEGAPIPEGYDDFGRIRYKVYQGETVISRLNESTLKNIAQLSGGIYRRVEDGKALKALIREIDKIPYKIRWKDAEASEKGELYQIFVLLSFISFVLWLFLTDWKPRFKTPLMVGFISLLLGGCTWGSDLQFRYYNHQGVESFKKEDLVSAEELFQTSRNFMVEPSVIPDNQMGLIYYAREDYKKAR
ncbi:MAG TPA: VWA domain-containing protein, partial [Candidatus Gracilibacteria bacterium]